MKQEKNRILLSPPHMGGNEQKYIAEAFVNNWIAPFGPNIKKFEKDLEYYLKENSNVVGLNSGTAAIHLGLILLGVKSGDEVLCQSLTFSASANPIVYLGAKPIFIDSEKETWNMCPITLENAILDRIEKGNKPKVIIAVHLYGMPFKVQEIKKISEKYNIPILEDSAEALGSTYNNQKCGTFGDISVLSFNGNKIITTSGGGALIAKSKEIKDRAVFLATQAKDNAPHYQHSEIGYNYRMSNICAGIGIGQMEVLDSHILARREINAFYKTFFENNKNICLLKESNDNFYSNHWLSIILLESYEKREILRNAFEEANIETRPVWKPMHLQPIFKEYPYYGSKNSENLFERGLCLPSGSNLTDNDKTRISKVISSFIN
ncbi:pyridoxal phosphate-dependent aminotransferase [Flavobacterium sp. 316]|uniref:aminotransferase class I/II-fold pyridoxal phosphate-dependent enzyme n=1 Tax=Flavobacterium sp. 316 TaxID=1603293 RepID=UPI0005E75574|nr:aminotransferase class I/II-fold pyridoxal phosphate-dependent enzyme [Flavobacterium sp. 316]KIX19800.1 pyridoxal phosphate-dependent aminotransferase [Flavobacterium sp. 316]